MLCGVTTTLTIAAVGRCLAPQPFSNTHRRCLAALSLPRSVALIARTAGNSPRCTAVTVAAVADSVPGQNQTHERHVRHCIFSRLRLQQSYRHYMRREAH
ncbi:TPA: hypothetical protein ACH3X2_003470 [Trebouxia sp. C0005]